MKLIYPFICISIVGCSNTKQDEEFQLSLESCYEMKADKSHRFWKQPIAVQGCEMLITEYELQKYKEQQ